MSPRGLPASTPSSPSSPAPPRSVSGPYPQRRASQPKSTRVQYAACGACRMRRVRCDLKDLPISAGRHPSCSNCAERGLKCVDEFAEVKAVKLLRRGRRLQQVEAIYGKAADLDGTFPTHPSPRISSIIPPLKIEFFSSPFWRWFSIHRPILDPAEFPARFVAHANGSQPLGHEGGIIAMLLVIWATSFGLDASGIPMDDDNRADHDGAQPRSSLRSSTMLPAKHPASFLGDCTRQPRKEKAESMLREVLELVDLHAVVRKPSWDGVRILLLLLPLLEDVPALERLVLQQATSSQSLSICTFVPSPPHPLLSSDDSFVRARIFWYGYIQEGITVATRGGRLVFSEDDLDAFQSSLPAFQISSPALPSPTSPSFPPAHRSELLPPISSHPPHPYLHITHLFSIPLRLSAVCRRLHAVLTGSKAVGQIEQSSGLNLDASGLRDIWDRLDRCWEEFEGVRTGDLATGDVDPMVDRFVSSWQIYIFECHNIIREALKQHARSSPASSPNPMFPSTHMQHHSRSPSPSSTAFHLHSIAVSECLRLLPATLTIVKRHIQAQSDQDVAGLFRWDSGLVRDGVFFAGYLAASLPDDGCLSQSSSDSADDRVRPFLLKQEPPEAMDLLTARRVLHIPYSGRVSSAEEGVSVCLQAISDMRWAFSKSDEREENIRRLWEENQLNRQPQFSSLRADHVRGGMEFSQSASSSSNFIDHMYGMGEGGKLMPNGQNLPSLSTLQTSSHIDSGPSTACSADGSNTSGWPSYTPPGTSTSGTTSTTNLSASGSPVFPPLGGNVPNVAGGFKAEGDEGFYHHVTGDLEQFSFNGTGSYEHQSRIAAMSSHVHHSSGDSTYIDFGSGSSNTTSMLGGDDGHGCSQFEDCNSAGFYH